MALGIAQIIAWGSTFYLLAILGKPIAEDTGWPLQWVVGGLSVGLLVAGLISPEVGRAISRYGGRAVLAASSAILGIGLFCIGESSDLLVYVAAWALLGLGMGAGLYDAAFATLGVVFREESRSAVTQLTLIAGFASSVSWPFSALLVTHFGWRTTCLAYGVLQIAVALPIHLLVIPRPPALAAVARQDNTTTGARLLVPVERKVFGVLAVALTILGGVAAVLSVHLINMMKVAGFPLSAAVGYAALIGPSQVAARAVEVAFGRHYHALWSLLTSSIFVAAGILVLLVAPGIVGAGVILYGAGIGIGSIARGTVPLAIFGVERYPRIMGRLALPNFLAQAAAPTLGALVIAGGTADELFEFLVPLSVTAIGLSLFLLKVARR